MLKYYTVPWSRHCKEGEKILTGAGVSFSSVEVKDLGAASWDLDFDRLPLLLGRGVRCEGLAQVTNFVTVIKVGAAGAKLCTKSHVHGSVSHSKRSRKPVEQRARKG